MQRAKSGEWPTASPNPLSSFETPPGGGPLAAGDENYPNISGISYNSARDELFLADYDNYVVRAMRVRDNAGDLRRVQIHTTSHHSCGVCATLATHCSCVRANTCIGFCSCNERVQCRVCRQVGELGRFAI